MTQTRSADMDRAWSVGRNARICGLDIKEANVELARQLRWQGRKEFDDALLDECERAWNAEDLLRFRE